MDYIIFHICVIVIYLITKQITKYTLLFEYEFYSNNNLPQWVKNVLDFKLFHCDVCQTYWISSFIGLFVFQCFNLSILCGVLCFCAAILNSKVQ